MGVRFPAKWLQSVLDRLRAEFGIKEDADPVAENREKAERGLNDLAGMLLPPLRSRSFIIEPRMRR